MINYILILSAMSLNPIDKYDKATSDLLERIGSATGDALDAIPMENDVRQILKAFDAADILESSIIGSKLTKAEIVAHHLRTRLMDA